MNTRLEAFANGKFMTELRKFSEKLSQSPAFSAISSGMSANMGIIMIGAVIQIFLAIGGLIFGWESGTEIYETIYMPYKLTMGILGLFMSFALAYNYSKRLKIGSPMQSGFIAIVCFILVVSPVQSVTVGENTFDALNLDSLGSMSLFVALIIGLVSVRISKFAIDRNWIIKMSDVVPEGVIAGFNSIIPAGLNIIVWYGLSVFISKISSGALTLPTLIMDILSIPINYLVTPLGMIVILLLGQIFWFFGIHGTGVIFPVIMVPFINAYMTNAELASQGLPLVFNAIFLYGACACVGGSGNTLPLVLMGLRSKSEQIRAVSKAALVPGIFNINEPVIFGYPIMYNPILLIPFVLSPIITMLFLWAGYVLNILSYPSILILSVLPIGLGEFMSTLDWKNALFPFFMIPILWLLYLPFFKVYEKQLIEREEKEALKAQENN